MTFPAIHFKPAALRSFSANRNQPKKKVDLLLKGYAQKWQEINEHKNKHTHTHRNNQPSFAYYKNYGLELNDLWNVKLTKLCRKYMFLCFTDDGIFSFFASSIIILFRFNFFVDANEIFLSFTLIMTSYNRFKEKKKERKKSNICIWLKKLSRKVTELLINEFTFNASGSTKAISNRKIISS